MVTRRPDLGGIASRPRLAIPLLTPFSGTPAPSNLIGEPATRGETFRHRRARHDARRRRYQVATPGLATLAKTAVIERAVDHPSRRSDHAPVTVTYEA